VRDRAARKETRLASPRVGGDGLVTAGIAIGWIQIGLVALILCFALALLLLRVRMWGSLILQ
jgi:hypothetical protein